MGRIKIIEIYEDDFIVFSKERGDHVQHLRKVFERCRKYGISLNPKKFVLGVDEGRLLRHVISKEGSKDRSLSCRIHPTSSLAEKQERSPIILW